LTAADVADMSDCFALAAAHFVILIIIIIKKQDLYSVVMPLGVYRGAGGTGR